MLDAYDVNVSPDKRTILLHNEGNLVVELKVNNFPIRYSKLVVQKQQAALESYFAHTRATYDVGGGSRKPKAHSQTSQHPESDTASELHGKNLENEGQDQGSQEYCQPRTSVAVAVDHSARTSILPEVSPTLTQNEKLSATRLKHPPTFANSPGFVAPADSPEIRDDEAASSIPESPNHGVVLDTSQATWSKHLPTKSQPISGSLIDSSTLSPDPTSADQESARKKRKSEAGSIWHGERQPGNEANSCTQLKLSRTTSNAGSMLKHYDSRTTLRSQLASFARPGSQISLASLSTDESMEEVRQDDIEVDELDLEIQDSVSRKGKNRKYVDIENAVDDPRRILPSDVTTSAVVEANPPTESDGSTIDMNVDDEDMDDPTLLLNQVRSSSSALPTTISQKDQVVHPEIIKTDKFDSDLSVRLDIDKLKLVWSQKTCNKVDLNTVSSGKDAFPPDAGVSNIVEDERAVVALSRVIKKEDFENMVVIGQFNLGFIVVRRRTSCVVDEMDDLFIVDQHAADEKYNFETLQATTKIQSQKLFRCVYCDFYQI